MPATSHRRRAGLLLAGLSSALASFTPAPAWANDRDLRGTPVPAAACVEVFRSSGLTEDPRQAGYFVLAGESKQARLLRLSCPFPVDNVGRPAAAGGNAIPKLRVRYRDSDGFGGGAGVHVVLAETLADAGGQAQDTAACLWASNAYGTGATTTTEATTSCAHDLAAGAYSHVDVYLLSSAGQTAQFLGFDFPL